MCIGSNEQAEWLRALREARDSEPSVPFEKLAFASQANQPENSQQPDSDGYWDCQQMSSSASQSIHGQSDDQGNSLPVAELVSDSSDYDQDNELSNPGTRQVSIQPDQGVSQHPQTPTTSPKFPSTDAAPPATPAPDLGSTIVMQGVLYKHCVGYKVTEYCSSIKLLKAWRSRWFVLRETQLCYYKNDKVTLLVPSSFSSVLILG